MEEFLLSDLESFLVLGIISLSFFLGFFVFLKNKKNYINRYFFLFSLSLAFYIGSAYISEFFPKTNPSLAILFSKLTYVGVIGGTFFLFLFSFYFPQKSKLSFKILWGSKILGIILAGLIFFSNWFISGIKIQPWGFDILYGFLYHFFVIYVFSLLAISFFNFLKSYKKSLGFQKDQLNYFLTGLGIFVSLTILFDVIFPFLFGIEKYYRFGNYSFIFFLAFTAYTITSKRLFGIRLILAEILVVVIGILLLIQAILSDTILEFSWKSFLFLIFLVFGYFLVKGVLREIELREKLQKAYSELQKLDKAKTEFLSIASHQLRTPLTAVKGLISMLLEGSYGKFSDKAKKPLENVYKSNQRLIRLVNDLLNVSRIETGKMELELKKISIENIISNVIEELKPKAKKKAIYLKWEKSTKALPKIYIDQRKIRQVILNVIDNGIRYTNQGGVTVKTQSLDLAKIQLIVSDTGEGMTKEETDHLFESFSRGKAGARFWMAGAGLGLFVAKKFVKLHRGQIWAESAGKGKGSTFYIELPIK